MTESASPEATPEKQNALMQTLEWMYEKITKSSDFFSKHDQSDFSATDADIDSWINWAIAAAGGAGFMAGVGGLIVLPVALPAGLASVYSIQIALAAKIAVSRGYDLSDEKVKHFTILCLCGNAAVGIANKAGIAIAEKIAVAAIKAIPYHVLLAINKAVGFQLLAKGGQQAVVQLAKFVPVAGGLVGGSVDALTTAAVGKAAKALFPPINRTNVEMDSGPEPTNETPVVS